MRAVGLALGAVLLVAWVYGQPAGLPWTETYAARLVREGGAAADEDVAALAARLRSAFSYETRAGWRVPYPPGFDVYLWLRHARNQLRHGTTCDTVERGVCRDALASAPVGASMRYARSLHIAAIVLVHRVWSLVADPPLLASVLLVPVLAAALGVLAVFAGVRRLFGDVGAFCTAIVTFVTPHVVVRSVGGDNDIWHIVLPASVLSVLVGALTVGATRRALLLAVAAGGLMALHADTWSGWIFTFAVLGVGGLAGLVLASMAERRGGCAAGGRRRVLVVLPAFLVVTVIGVVLLGKGDGLRELAAALADALPRKLAPAGGSAFDADWPSTFRTVAELQRPLPSEIIEKLGGGVTMWAALVGVVVFCLPAGVWRRWHYGLLIASAVLYASFVLGPDGSHRSVLALLAALPVLVLTLGALGGEHLRGGYVPRAIVVVWLVAAFHQALQGSRFILLAALPLGVGVGALLGRLHAGGTRALVREPRAERVMLALVVALLLLPVGTVRRTLGQHVGHMSDAWWETLTELAARTPSDAIINAWWDYGHWIKYVAERRVSVDGSTLRTHVPHWMARALLAESEHETVGLLRMLNCGSDATPEPEGHLGAWGKLVGYDLSPARSHALVATVAGLDRAAAGATLAAAGLASAAVRDVLRATHCAPPPSYLLVSSHEALLPGLGFLGGWDLRRAQLAVGPEAAPEAVAARLGYDVEAARIALAAARRYAAAGDLDMFVAPPVEYLHGGWLACEPPGPDGRTPCRIAAAAGAALELEQFVYVPSEPAASRLHLRARGTGGGSEALYGEPGVVVRAEADRLVEYRIAGATHPEIGVLVDEERNAILVAPPSLLRATLTHLIFLDGRYLRRLQPFAARRSILGERIGVWRVVDAP